MSRIYLFNLLIPRLALQQVCPGGAGGLQAGDKEAVAGLPQQAALPVPQ